MRDMSHQRNSQTRPGGITDDDDDDEVPALDVEVLYPLSCQIPTYFGELL